MTARTHGQAASASPVARPLPAEDEALVSLLGAGDARALEALYERHSRAVYSLAVRLLGDGPAAEDVVQETFLKLWRQPANYDPGRGRLLPWLLGVAHHHAIDQVRRRQLEQRRGLRGGDGAALLEGLETASAEADPHARATAVEAHQAVVQALAALPAEQRLPLQLAYYRGLSQSEIARALGEPLGTIKTRMRLGLQRLRAVPMLADLWGDR
jgi:RNA polymerase sigma-70 factor, ECF subfamily